MHGLTNDDAGDDDEEEDTPESILRAAQSGEQSQVGCVCSCAYVLCGVLNGPACDGNEQSRADRQILTPWLKYLWDTYRTILEVLRNNAKLELVYQVCLLRV